MNKKHIDIGLVFGRLMVLGSSSVFESKGENSG